MKKFDKESIMSAIECYIMLFLVCFMIYQHIRITEAQTQLAELNATATQIELDIENLRNDLVFKTHPSAIDSSLRDWFEGTLKNNPNQVRGVDGKLPKER